MALALRAASLRSPVQIGSPADLSNPRGSSSHHPERRSPRTRGLLCSGAGDGKDSGHPWPSRCGRPRCAHPSKSAVLQICRTHVGPHPITRNDEAPARGGFFVLERVMGKTRAIHGPRPAGGLATLTRPNRESCRFVEPTWVLIPSPGTTKPPHAGASLFWSG